MDINYFQKGRQYTTFYVMMQSKGGVPSWLTLCIDILSKCFIRQLFEFKWYC